jgi:phosphoglycolate phosphatase
MRVFVGPPLRDSFLRFGVKPEEVEGAIAIYRSRYVPIGMFENTPYPGIKALLGTLKDAGHRLILATSKPESMATAIVEKFQLAPFFEMLCGASMDSSRDSKDKVIGYVLEKIGDAMDVVMIGDTAYDVTGAAVYGIPTIGVSWGYGTVEDMRTAGATAIVDTPAQLLELLL